MIKTYTFGSVITSIIGSAPMPSYTMGPESTKIRYKEPYVSEAQNLKDSGIIPTGIYAGFTPLAIGSDTLQLQVDVARGDSVAVVETRLGRYNMTVRASSNIDLDFTAYPTFPSLVVLRSAYSLTPTPLSGMTSSQVLVVSPALDDTNPANLNTGDIRVCRVTGLAGGGVVTFTTVYGTDRDTSGIATVVGVSKTAFVRKTSGDLGVGDSGGAYVDIAGTSVSFTLTQAQTVLVFVCANGATSGSNPATLALNLKVNGSYVAVGTTGFGANSLGGLSWEGGQGGGVHIIAGNLGFSVPVSLGVGVHTVLVGYRCQGPFGGACIGASAAAPLSVAVLYT